MLVLQHVTAVFNIFHQQHFPEPFAARIHNLRLVQICLLIHSHAIIALNVLEQGVLLFVLLDHKANQNYVLSRVTFGNHT